MKHYQIDLRTGKIVVEEPGKAPRPLDQPLVAGRVPCIHLGQETGERRLCPSCRGHVEVKLRECATYGQCTTHKKLDGLACCVGCLSYRPNFDILPKAVAHVASATFDLSCMTCCQSIPFPCCNNGWPSTLYATTTYHTGSTGCPLPELTLSLGTDSTDGQPLWYGVTALPDCSNMGTGGGCDPSIGDECYFALTLRCCEPGGTPNFAISVECGPPDAASNPPVLGCTSPSSFATSVDCSTFSITFSNVPAGTNCNNGGAWVDISISSTP